MPGLFYYFADPDLGAEASAVLNDSIAQACRAYPERLIPMGNVPLQDIELAIAELERVVKEYAFTAVEIGASVNGRNYDEPEFDAFFRRAAELDVLIFVHPSSPPGREQLRRYYMQNTIGFPVETAICVSSLIFGGVFARYPNIKVCLAHGGGVAPSLVGRWDHGWEARAEASQAIDRPPSEYFASLYFDDLVHSDRILGHLIDIAGVDRVVVGTDYPFDMGDRTPADTLARQALADSDHDLIASETVSRLLRLNV
jgi:aminocarboxymuconate-semialdehyde decarboxylase